MDKFKQTVIQLFLLFSRKIIQFLTPLIMTSDTDNYY